ncbi:MAG: type II 3-dehydroquinate dehydratase, partial [Desulfobacterales bacterium]
GLLVDTIQQAIGQTSGIIINPGAYTHTSIAIRDALLLLDIPIIEVHLSNTYKRETFRRKSLIADIVTGRIVGLGAIGYILALQAIADMLKDKCLK